LFRRRGYTDIAAPKILSWDRVPVKDGSCSSETKNYIRTAPRSELFASKRKLQNQRPEPRKAGLGSRSGDGGFYNSETKHDRITAQRPELLLQRGDYINISH
jgi:hypothetical protein